VSTVKFSIVTPSYNSARFIRETILSVISQKGNFFVEYIVVDNCSTDGTREIIEEFQNLLKSNIYHVACNGIQLSLISEPDVGMYDAINKGFSIASGDLFAWINADDIYLPGAFETVYRVFDSYDDIHWLKGITSYITDRSCIWKAGRCLLYTQKWIMSGIYGRDHYFIQQDSVFWRAWLWKEVGGIDSKYRFAGDYYLWIKFSELVPLVSLVSWVSCFRSVNGQLSQDIAAYNREARSISEGTDSLSKRARLFLRCERHLPSFLKPVLFRLVFGRVVFTAVKVGRDGILNVAFGEYYEVSSVLWV
jgi:glycosyltransferase involved in cell wall biosynthesis